MSNDIKVAMIGLDTSHATEFAKRFQGPQCPKDQRVSGLKVVNCLSFYTQFMKDEARKSSQEDAMKECEINITEDFDEAVNGCDAIMIEINDPSLHLEYFSKCADLGKPIFLDKPLADTVANGKKIRDITKQTGLKVFSSSALRFTPVLEQACQQIPKPLFATAYGPLGKAPAGSGIVWYGVHTFEMIQRAMGPGAKGVFVHKDETGLVAMVRYADGRRAVVELRDNSWPYGGNLRTEEEGAGFSVDFTRCYSDLLERVVKFFAGGDAPLTIDDTLEVMAMLEATQKSYNSGQEESV